VVRGYCDYLRFFIQNVRVFCFSFIYICIYVFSHAFSLGCVLRAHPFCLPMWGVARVGPNLYRHRDFHFLIIFQKVLFLFKYSVVFFVYRLLCDIVLCHKANSPGYIYSWPSHLGVAIYQYFFVFDGPMCS
jgi:hypothetical protein